MPNVAPRGIYGRGSQWWPIRDVTTHRDGSHQTVQKVHARDAGGVWRTVWQEGPTWSPVATMRPPSITYSAGHSFGMVPERAIDTSTTTFWMSYSNSISEGPTAYEAIRVSLGNPPGTVRWNSITVYCNAAYRLYLGIRKPSGSWEGAIMPNPTYGGTQGAQIQHAYAAGGNQTTATRTFSLGDRTDLANAEIQFTATKLAVVPGYSGFRMAVKDIVVAYQTQV